MTGRSRRAAPILAFAALCYAPLLLTAPGQVVADTKSYLYLDPGRLLARAWSMWDPHVGLGTVTHQNIGFLWPMGPWYWLFEQLGAPDWVAQRLWVGSILFLAGLGMRYLLRTFGWRGPAVGAAMCAYALSPYLLTIVVRISAILLPFVALPWLVALVARGARHGGWRHPAAFALVVATVGTSNATSILLVGLAPVLWLCWAVAVNELRPVRALTTALRTGGLTILTNLWWIAGLAVQATHGVEVLRYTESVEVTAAASAAQEILRGLGYWFFYGDDAIGPWVGPSRPFQTNALLVAATFAVPVLALLAGSLTRWRARSYAVLLLVVGLILAVGTYPYRDPSPLGSVLKVFLLSDVGMAMRSLPRAAPLVVLALVMLLAGGLRALAGRWPRASLPSAAVVIALVVMALPPLWQGTLAPDNLSRPEEIPTWWERATDRLEARDDGTRVLIVPGTDFTSYRWGTTVDPVAPGLMDRPIVARELIPQGGGAGWNLLKALDGRFQRHVAEPDAIAPIARMLRAGDVLVRSDLQFEHYDTPRPRTFWQTILGANGLGEPVGFGPPVTAGPDPDVPMLDELALTTDPDLPTPPAVAILPVQDPVPIVSVKPPASPVVVAGDGEGLVDLAAAGLLHGDELVRYSASMTGAELDQALEDGAVLVVTDTNRRRAERWGTIRFTDGYTEPAGHRPLRTDRSDARLPVFPDADDESRTVAMHAGGLSANATSYGGRNEYLPEDRPANAVDGDPTTAWRASRDDPVVGERLLITTDEPVTASTLTFLAPSRAINRWVTKVALRFDGGEPLVVDLDDSSRTAPGQTVDIGRRTFSSLEVEILADSAGPQGRYGGLTSTGFAEVTIGDGSLRLDERIRPPVALLERAGAAALDHPLAIVVTRLRSAPTDIERLDEEPALVRELVLPHARSMSLTGTARLSPRADDDVLDGLLGLAQGVRAAASSRLPALGARAAAAIDGDVSTAWVSSYGDQIGQWIEVTAPRPVTIDQLGLEVVADGRHSLPAGLRLEVDGRPVAELTLPPVAEGNAPEATTAVSLPLPRPVTGNRIRLVVTSVDERTTADWSTRKVRTLPVGLAEVDIAGLRRPAPSDALAGGCRGDLLELDGQPVPIEVSGTVEAAISGKPLTISACGADPLVLEAGHSVLRGAPGDETGLDLDRLVLRSGPGGDALADARAPLVDAVNGADGGADPSLQVTDRHRAEDTVEAHVVGATPGEDIWIIFGQSHSSGWSATIGGEELGESRLVDGFANGWRISAPASSFDVTFEFEPQRRVDIALWISLLSALVCLVLVLRPPRAGSRTDSSQEPAPVVAILGRPTDPPLPPRWAVAAVAVAAVSGAVLVDPWVGAALAALALAAAVGPALVVALVAPAAMALSAGYVVIAIWRRHPQPGLEWITELTRAHPLAWFAVLALAVDAVVAALRRRRRQAPS